MTREEFGVGMIAFCAVSEKEYPEESLDIFFNLLKDLNGESYLAAIRILCRSHKEIYPNTNVVALIRDKVAEIENPNPIPEEAWEIVLKSFNDARIKFSSAVQRTVNLMGGRDELRWIFHDSEKPSIIRAQFMNYYSSIAKQEHADRVSPELATRNRILIEEPKKERPKQIEPPKEELKGEGVQQIIENLFKAKAEEEEKEMDPKALEERLKVLREQSRIINGG